MKNHWEQGDCLTVYDLNTMVSRISALESAIQNPDYLTVFVKGFEAGRAAQSD